MAKIYYTETSKGKRYSNLTQKDRIMLRNAKGKGLTSEQKTQIFGANPVFIKGRP